MRTECAYSRYRRKKKEGHGDEADRNRKSKRRKIFKKL